MHALWDRNQGISQAVEPLPLHHRERGGRRTSHKTGLLQTFAAAPGLKGTVLRYRPPSRSHEASVIQVYSR
jgi:hypothetical protein